MLLLSVLLFSNEHVRLKFEQTQEQFTFHQKDCIWKHHWCSLSHFFSFASVAKELKHKEMHKAGQSSVKRWWSVSWQLASRLRQHPAPPHPPTTLTLNPTQRKLTLSCCPLFLLNSSGSYNKWPATQTEVQQLAAGHSSVSPAQPPVCLLVSQVITTGLCVLKVQTLGPSMLLHHWLALKKKSWEMDGWGGRGRTRQDPNQVFVCCHRAAFVCFDDARPSADQRDLNSAAHSSQRPVISPSAASQAGKGKSVIFYPLCSPLFIPIRQKTSRLGVFFVFLHCWVFRRHYRNSVLPQICGCFLFFWQSQTANSLRDCSNANRTFDQLFPPRPCLWEGTFKGSTTPLLCPVFELISLPHNVQSWNYSSYEICAVLLLSSGHHSGKSLSVIKLFTLITMSQTHFPDKFYLWCLVNIFFFWSDHLLVLKRFSLLKDLYIWLQHVLRPKIMRRRREVDLTRYDLSLLAQRECVYLRNWTTIIIFFHMQMCK